MEETQTAGSKKVHKQVIYVVIALVLQLSTFHTTLDLVGEDISQETEISPVKL